MTAAMFRTAVLAVVRFMPGRLAKVFEMGWQKHGLTGPVRAEKVLRGEPARDRADPASICPRRGAS